MHVLPMGRRVCAWCSMDMGPAPVMGCGVTHGICHACHARLKAELAEMAASMVAAAKE